ncbi:MAG: 3'(2'),5'-bisphosphate nucleotidase [Proteobacteria bacterium]|nr:MAG: 3'(2'),5'-bisphosphate nucleotidase [Pseudomonadota bacterium]
MQPEQLLDPVRDIAIEAGHAIMEIYGRAFDIDEKTDGSPVTTADMRAHAIIANRLERLTPDVPVLSEESSDTVFEARRDWRRFWLVDPLDGTKEFIRRNGEFTVNIALIEGASPVLGVVYTPAQDIVHQAAEGAGAQRIAGGTSTGIRCRSFDRREVCLVASRSHAGAAVDRYRAALEQDVDRVRTTSMGSALKICLVAEGAADIYPRLGPTSEWDTAASHCVLNEAGGRLTDVHGHDLSYNKKSLLNPWFLALGDPSHDWLRYLPPDEHD